MEFTSEADDEQIEVSDDYELKLAVREVNVAAQEVAEAQLTHAEAKERLVKLLEQRGEKSLYVEIEGKVYKATTVAPERTKVDEEGLRKVLGARRFNALTTRKIDVKLLTRAVAEGKIEAGVVSEHVQIVPTNPYPKVTQIERTSEE